MFKKLVSIALVAAMCLSLAACGGGSQTSSASSEPAAASSAAASSAAASAEAASAEASSAASTEAASAEASSAASSAAAATEAPDTTDWVKMDLVRAEFVGPTNDGAIVMDHVFEILEERAPGWFTCETHYSGTLLPVSDMLDGVINGLADIVFVEPSYYPTRLPVTMALSEPITVYNSDWVACQVLNEFMKEHKPKELDGVVYLMGYSSGALAMYTTKQKLESVKDVKGLQMRANSNVAKLVTALGAVPVALGPDEIYEAFRTGMVDGGYANGNALGGSGIGDLGGYCLMNMMGTQPDFYLMNEQTFNRMPKSQQDFFMGVIDEVFQNEFSYVTSTAMLNNESMHKFWQEAEISFMTDEDYAYITEVYQPVLDEYLQSLEDAGIDSQEVVDTLKALAEKYNAQDPAERYKNQILTAHEK